MNATDDPQMKVAPTAPRPTNKFLQSPSESADIGTWGDPTDMADREALENARRDQAGERPPHY